MSKIFIILILAILAAAVGGGANNTTCEILLQSVQSQVGTMQRQLYTLTAQVSRLNYNLPAVMGEPLKREIIEGVFSDLRGHMWILSNLMALLAVLSSASLIVLLVLSCQWHRDKKQDRRYVHESHDLDL